VPVLVIPLGLLALRVLGVVAFYMMVEPAQISVRYSLSVAAVSLSALCGVVDVSLLRRRVVDILRVFWVRVLVVVAPVALWHSGGLSLAAGWMAAASAPLVLWANLARSFGCAAGSGSGRLVIRAQRCFEWLLRAAPVVRGSLRVRHPRWRVLGLADGCAIGWPFSFGAATVPQSEVQLRACVRCNSRSGSHWMAVAVIMLGMLPRSEAVGDLADLAAALLTAAGSGGFLWLVVPEKADPGLLHGMVFFLLVVYVSQWLTAQQEPVARQYAQQTTVAAVSAAGIQTAATAEVQVKPQYFRLGIFGEGARKGFKHLRRARYWWQLQRAKLLVQQWQLQLCEESAAVAAEMQADVAEEAAVLETTMDHAAVAVEKRAAEMAAGMQAAEERYKAAVTTETVVAAAKDQSAAEEQQQPEKQQQRASRRRHRVRRRANGAPRSCVLESGRWINLPRARRAAAHTIAVVQVRKQRRKQQPCRFNDSNSGCKRSQCRYAPAGHAPAVDGADVLDPLVAAKLENLVGSVQAGLEQRQQEQLQRLQLQQQRSIDQLRLQLEQQEQQLQSLRDGQWQQQQQHQHQAMEGKGQQQRQQNKEISAIRASCEQQKAKYLRGAISGLQAEIHDLKRNVTLSYPFEVEMRHAIEDIDRLKATFTRRGIALSMLDVANTQ